MIWFEARNVCAALRSFAMNGTRRGLSEAAGPPPPLHPNMAAIDRQRISALYEGLRNEDRVLVDLVTLVPNKRGLEIMYDNF
ncbi:hypothetical protein V1289_003392 [Bradyrhizobium sp. AZCC 2289]